MWPLQGWATNSGGSRRKKYQKRRLDGVLQIWKKWSECGKWTKDLKVRRSSGKAIRIVSKKQWTFWENVMHTPQHNKRYVSDFQDKRSKRMSGLAQMFYCKQSTKLVCVARKKIRVLLHDPKRWLPRASLRKAMGNWSRIATPKGIGYIPATNRPRWQWPREISRDTATTDHTTMKTNNDKFKSRCVVKRNVVRWGREGKYWSDWADLWEER